MIAQNLIVSYLDKTRLMQLATADNNQPWCCTVHFAHDNLHNLYWISDPHTKHSQHIAKNPNVAASMVVPISGPSLPGIQVAGTAREITDPKEVELLFGAYAERYTAHNKLADIISGKNPHHLYQLKPKQFILFDHVNFPDQPRQEWNLQTN